MSAVIIDRATVTDVRIFDNFVFQALNSNDNGGALFCTESSTVTISGSTFSSNAAINAGGAVFTAGVSTVSNTNFQNNSALYGGAFCMGGSYSSELSEVTMLNNTASFGGAIYNTGLFFMEESTLKTNVATVSGGAFYNTGIGSASESSFIGNTATYAGAFMNVGIFTLKNCKFTSNTASVQGGAIDNEEGGSLIVSGSTFSSNTASANGGAISMYLSGNTVSNSKFTSNCAGEIGGAVYHCGNTFSSLLDGDIFTSNKAVYGGALCNMAGILSITGCTFSKNNASTSGGAFYNGANSTISGSLFTGNTSAFAGALYMYLGENTIANSTFSSNRAQQSGGAVCHNGGTVAALFDGDIFTLNSAQLGGAFHNQSGTASIQGCTFSKNYSTLYGGGIENDATTKIFNSFFVGNISICGGALFNNEGIVEIQTSTFSNGGGQFGGAVFNENGTVSVAGGCFTSNTCSTGGAIYNEFGTTIIDDSLLSANVADDGGAIFSSSANMTVSGSTFTANTVSSAGGAIRFAGATFSLSVSNTEFSANNGAYGGALLLDSGIADFSNVTFLSNLATFTGGALYNCATAAFSGSEFCENIAAYGAGIANFSRMSATNSTFSGNYAAVFGGAIYNANGNLEITGCEFSQNIAEQSGAALYHAGTSSAKIDFSTFSDNLSVKGAAIANYAALELTNCLLKGNTATNVAAVLYTEGSDSCTVSDCLIENNNAAYGGCFMSESGMLTIANSTITGNIGTVSGGVLYNSGTASISNSSASNNNALYGGVIMNVGTGCVFLDNSIMSGNTATTCGGVLNNSGTLTSDNSTFSGNYAILGGVIRNDSTASSILKNSSFDSNTATYGGAIFNEGGFVSLSDSTFTNNKGTSYGGAVYNSGNFLCKNTVFEKNTSGYGAICNVGTATVSNAVFKNNISNYAGALYNCGTAGSIVLDGVTFSGNEALFGGAILNEAYLTIGNVTFENNFALYTGSAIYNSGIITVTGVITLSSASENICNNGYIYVDTSKFDLSAGYALIVNAVQTGWRTGYRFAGNENYGFTEIGTNGYLVARQDIVTVNSAWENKSFGEIVIEGYTCGINAFGDLTEASSVVVTGGTIVNTAPETAPVSGGISGVTITTSAIYASGEEVYFINDNIIGGVIYAGDATDTPEDKNVTISGTTATRAIVCDNFSEINQTAMEGQTQSYANIAATVSDGSFAKGILAGEAKNSTIYANTTITVSESNTGNVTFGGMNITTGTADAPNNVTINGDSAITLTDVTNTLYTNGGSLITHYGNEVRKGDITVNVDGGSFASVSGGSLIQSSKGVTEGLISSEINGKIAINISGDAVIDSVYGGSGALKTSTSVCANVTGDIAITIDVTEDVTIKNYIFAGGMAKSMVKGNTALTIKGAGDGTDYLGAKILSGESSYAKGSTLYVSGEKSLVLSNFSGKITGRVAYFDTITIDATSQVEFTAANSYLDEGLSWNISADKASNVSVNLTCTGTEFYQYFSFADSELSFNCTDIDNAGTEWTIFQIENDSIEEHTIQSFDGMTAIINGDVLSETDPDEDSVAAFEGNIYRLEYRIEEDNIGKLVAFKLEDETESDKFELAKLA